MAAGALRYINRALNRWPHSNYCTLCWAGVQPCLVGSSHAFSQSSPPVLILVLSAAVTAGCEVCGFYILAVLFFLFLYRLNEVQT